jgi:hypothetical protein
MSTRLRLSFVPAAIAGFLFAASVGCSSSTAPDSKKGGSESELVSGSGESAIDEGCPEAADAGPPCVGGCNAGDWQIESETACLQDDAVCYSREACGSTIWCTGPGK